MTEFELQESINQAEKEFLIKKKKLQKDYADEHNPYKVGDMVEDHIGRVLVEKIGYQFHTEPKCVYTGTIINKDGSKSKLNKKRDVYQQNILKV